MVDLASGAVVAAPAPGVGEPDVRTTALAFRQALAGLLLQSAPGEPVPGILPAPGNPGLVSADAADMKYIVQPGVFVISRGDRGAYILALPEVAVVTTDPANATNPRIDRIYVCQPDPELSESGVARIDVAIGTPSSTPALPALPAGSLELGRKLVGANVTNTAAGTAISNLATFTALNTGDIDAADIVSGTLVSDRLPVVPLSKGGTGGTTRATARNGIGVFVQEAQPSSPSVGDLWAW